MTGGILGSEPACAERLRSRTEAERRLPAGWRCEAGC